MEDGESKMEPEFVYRSSAPSSIFHSLSSLLFLSVALQRAVKLPSLISDNMVLQRGIPLRIWGSADSGEAVRVDFQGQSVSTKAGADGKWVAWLKPLAAAGPLETARWAWRAGRAA